jgi:hypothetical protein
MLKSKVYEYEPQLLKTNERLWITFNLTEFKPKNDDFQLETSKNIIIAFFSTWSF